MKNNTLGLIPFSNERDIFNKRLEMISSLTEWGKSIVLEWEHYFYPSEQYGNKFSDLIKSYILEFEKCMKDSKRTDALDTKGSILVSSLQSGSYRTDLSRIMTQFSKFLFPISNPKAPMYVSDPESLGLNSIGIKTYYNSNYMYRQPKTARGNLYGVTVYPLGKYEFIYSSYLSNLDTTYVDFIKLNQKTNLDVILPLETTQVAKGTYPETRTRYLAYFGQSGSQYLYGKVDMVKITRLVDKPKEVVTERVGGNFEFAQNQVISVGGFQDLSFYTTLFTVSELLQEWNNIKTVIEFLESQNNAVEIRGNVDGVKLDAYEKILNDQLTSINNISDLAQSGLTNEKIEFQNKKNEYIKLIADKKAELARAIADKKSEILKMTNKVNTYESTLSVKKAEVLRNLETQIGK